MAFKTKYQIFISSTFIDLQKERNEVLRAVLEMGHIPVGMELFSASDEEQWETIKRRIDETDYYVILVAHRYGSTTKEGISYTEKEFEYAKSLKIPIIGLILKDGAVWNPDNVDKGGPARKIQALRKKVALGRTVKFFSSPEELHYMFAISLMHQIDIRPRVGWVRADQIPSNSTFDEFAKLTKERDELREIIGRNDEEHRTKEIQEFLVNYTDFIIVSEADQLAIYYNSLKFFMSIYNYLISGEEIFLVISNFVESTQARGVLGKYNHINNLSFFVEQILFKQVEDFFNLLVIKDVLEVYEVSRERDDNKTRLTQVIGRDKTYEVKKYRLTRLGRKVIAENIKQGV